MPCHSITGLRQFYNYFSSVAYYHRIGAFLATLCFFMTYCHFMFMVMFIFQFFFIFHIKFMFHEHIYTYCISYTFLISCLLHKAFHILILIQEYLRSHTSFIYSYSSMNLLYLGIGINPIGSSNSNYGIFMPTSHFTDFSRNSLYYLFFRGLDFIFGTISLYSFKEKVLRVLFQLESPNSEHRNSSYVRNNPDYSLIKTDAGIDLYMAPLRVTFWDT